jgi:hypothetical protein
VPALTAHAAWMDLSLAHPWKLVAKGSSESATLPTADDRVQKHVYKLIVLYMGSAAVGSQAHPYGIGAETALEFCFELRCRASQ